MKLTRSPQAKKAEFFRNSDSGKLINKERPEKDITIEIIQNLPNETSYIGRILRNPKHDPKNDKNVFRRFTDQLVRSQNTEKLSAYLPILKQDEKPEEVIKKSLSHFGRNLKYDKEGLSLEELINNYYIDIDIDHELNLLHKYIKQEIEFKIDKLRKSISQNTIPFDMKEDKLEPKTKKMKFLFNLLRNDGVDKSVFEDFKEKYSYSVLEDKIKKYIAQVFDNAETISCKKIYDMVLEYNQNFYENNKSDVNIEPFVFFLNEVRNHFRSYFPPKIKKDSQRRNNLRERNANYFCSEKYVFTQVWKHIVNQLVQGLILYGKLKHYYNNGSEIQTDKISSTGLSEIQMEEAFKKQMLLSLSRAATRLNYFYNFGSQNIGAFAPNCTLKDDGDIFLALADRQTFYQKITTDISRENDFKELKSKMATCYPLDDAISNDELCSFLEEIVQSCYVIRNNVFHYKKDTLFEVMKGQLKDAVIENFSKIAKRMGNTISFLPEYKNALLKRDIDNIQNQFKEQIRSSGIADFYTLNTLKEVFKCGNLSFYLYAPQYHMMPSFKNIFTRGCNISQGNKSPKESKWYREKDPLNLNSEAYLAYKNLLQLIYYHSFLPAIKNNETIITRYINKTIDWNKKVANEKQKNKFQYKYNDMPTYQGDSNLSDYLSNLQRLQSIRENDENIEKENYYSQFVKDIFVFAFNDYLQNKIPSLCETIKSPSKQMGMSETILADLFDSTDVSLKMKTEYNQLNEFAGIYIFLKLLEQRELNKLLHQFIRYRTSSQNDSAELLQIEELIALVQFTLPPPTTDENYNENVEKYFSKFIDGNYQTDYVDLYTQKEKTNAEENEKKYILQRSISLIGRSGAMAFYTDMFVQQKKLYMITKDDYNAYCQNNLSESNSISDIEKKQNEMQILHKQIVTAKKGDVIEDKITKYENLLKEIQQYNDCRHKVTFETLYKVYQIHIDILGRFASFAEDWESDVFFMLTALESLGKIDFNVNRVFGHGKVVGELCNKLKNKPLSLFCSLCWPEDNLNENKLYGKIQVRNTLAHLNHMTQCSKNGAQPSIIDIINKLRVLLAYDLKRQNTVTKSIQDLLLKDYKIKLILEPDKSKNKSENFRIKSLETERIVHLKNITTGHCKKGMRIKEQKGIYINANNAFIVDLIRKLLEFKYECESEANI